MSMCHQYKYEPKKLIASLESWSKVSKLFGYNHNFNDNRANVVHVLFLIIEKIPFVN